MKTTEQFIRDAEEVHGNTYDYSGTVYCGARVNTNIVCRLHGEFFQSPTNHLRGKGCNSCGYATSATKVSTGLDEIEAKLSNYPKINYVSGYKNYNTTCTFSCKEHGHFKKVPSLLFVTRHGCTACSEVAGSIRGRNLTLGEFISRVPHLGHIDFSKSIYVGSKYPLEYFCTRHNKYHSSKPNNLLHGYGCNECGDESSATKQKGFLNNTTIERSRDHYLQQSNNLYVLHLPEIGDDIYKIGIARSLYGRRQKILKDFGENYLHKVRVLSTYTAYHTEQFLHKHFKNNQYIVKDKNLPNGERKRGWTEIFSLSNEDLELLDLAIDEFTDGEFGIV